MKEYEEYYFKKNPRCRKSYFKNNWKNKKIKKVKYLYTVLSLNDLLPINSMVYSSLKKQWGDFGEWLASYYKLSNLNLENAVVEYRIFNETKIRKDCDNYSAKILNDGLFSKSGMFKDDSYYFINPFISGMEYNKDNPRTEIRISIIDEEIKDIYKKLIIHINNFK